jgi:hypothetical protein
MAVYTLAFLYMEWGQWRSGLNPQHQETLRLIKQGRRLGHSAGHWCTGALRKHLVTEAKVLEPRTRQGHLKGMENSRCLGKNPEFPVDRGI